MEIKLVWGNIDLVGARALYEAAVVNAKVTHGPSTALDSSSASLMPAMRIHSQAQARPLHYLKEAEQESSPEAHCYHEPTSIALVIRTHRCRDGPRS